MSESFNDINEHPGVKTYRQQDKTEMARKELRIRPLTVADIDEFDLEDSWKSFFHEVVDRKDWSQKQIRILVAEVSKQAAVEFPEEDNSQKTELVGFAYLGLGYPPYFPQLDENVKQLYMAHLSVSEQHRRKGYGTAMLEAFKEEAKMLGVDVFRAECEKGWRVDFYKQIGFQPVPYRGNRADYPDSQQMLELWFT